MQFSDILFAGRQLDQPFGKISDESQNQPPSALK
jgi:hypothetical protein